MLTPKYVPAVLMLTLILGMTACGQSQPDQPAVDQIVGTSTAEPTANPRPAITPPVAIVESPTVANPTPDIAPTVAAAIAAVESRTNPTPNIAQTVAAAIAAASPTATSTVPPLALTSTETPRPTSRPPLIPRTPSPTLTPIPAPIIPPTRKQALPVPAEQDWSIENDAAYGYRSITSADKNQRWTCIGADRPRINITHPAAHTVATAVAGRTAEVRIRSSTGNSTSWHGRHGRRTQNGRRKNTLSMCDTTKRCS